MNAARTSTFAAVRKFTARALNVVRLIVGVPDYETYVRHVRVHHPGTEPMQQDAFIISCWEAKYSRPGHRCC